MIGLLLFPSFAAWAGVEDVNLRDFPRLKGETDDAPRFRRAIAAAADGVLAVPKGEYEIGSMLHVTNRCSLEMHPNAHLKAVKKMDYVLFWDGHDDYHALSVFDGGMTLRDPAGAFIRGGDIDGRGLASCLALANAHHFTLRDIVLHNGRKTGLCVTRETGGHLYELVAENVYCKTTMSGLAGNVGIDCPCADCHFTDCIVVDYTVSIRDRGGANRFTRCHVWGGTVPPKGMGFKDWSEFYAANKKLAQAGKFDAAAEKALLAKGVPEMLVGSIAFDIRSTGSVFDGCYADTAEIGYNVQGRNVLIVSSGFFNNPRMGLRKSTAIVHAGGRLTVRDCSFVGAAHVEKLYAGKGENIVWQNNRVEGGDNMAADAVKLAASVARANASQPRVSRHVFSMSCKVTACNRELSTPEGKKRCIDWCRANGITKLWLESYRHTERVPTELLVAERDYFRSEGFEVAGMITPTQLNDAPDGRKPSMVVCWSDPVARQRLREEVVRVAPLFDTVIVDDFLFSSCGETCSQCRADKTRRGVADWAAYRRELMYEVAREEIVHSAKRANPKGHFIIKFPCWWRNWEQNGYSPKREAELFGSCWVGTETRDACQEPFQACWIVEHIQKLTDGRCGGGWYDALDCTPEKFVEQAYYTILSGAKESFIHCYDYLLAADPGVTPFGEKTDRSHACARLFEKKSAELRKLADFVSSCEIGPSHMQPNGVSIHLFRKDGKTYRARLNTKDVPVDGLTPHGFEFPQKIGESVASP